MQGVLPLFRSCISDMYIVHLHGVDESARTLDCSQFSRHWQKHVKANEKKSWFQHARECLSLRAPLLICKFSTSMMWMNLQGLANLHSWVVTDKHWQKGNKKVLIPTCRGVLPWLKSQLISMRKLSISMMCGWTYKDSQVFTVQWTLSQSLALMSVIGSNVTVTGSVVQRSYGLWLSQSLALMSQSLALMSQSLALMSQSLALLCRAVRACHSHWL